MQQRKVMRDEECKKPISKSTNNKDFGTVRRVKVTRVCESSGHQIKRKSSGLLPCRSTDETLFWDILVAQCHGIPCVEGQSVTGPLKADICTEVQREEDDDTRNGRSRIKTGGKDIIVSHPPSEGFSPDDKIEDEANEKPGDVVETGGWRDGAETGEADWDGDVAPDGKRIAASEEVEGEGKDRSDEEEVEQSAVGSSWAEESPGTNSTPDDGRRREGRRAGADEAVLLSGSAHVGNVVEHPFLNVQHPTAGDDGGKNLNSEHHAWGNLHVVTELEVTSEEDGLVGGDEPNCFKDHVGNRSSGDHVTSDELGQDLRRDGLIGDGLQHSEGKGEGGCEKQTNDSRPDRQMGRVNRNGDADEHEGDSTDGEVPPSRDFRVHRHKTEMDIMLILGLGTEAAHDIFAEPHYRKRVRNIFSRNRERLLTERVDKDCWEGSKCGAVGEGERRRHEQTGVSLVLGGVEKTISQDGGDVVVVSSVIEGIVRRNREVCRIPSIGDYSNVNDVSNAMGAIAYSI